MLIYVIISSLIVSLLAFIGILFVGFNRKLLDGILFILIAFAAGAMLGNAFFHLIPEVIEEGMDPLTVGVLLMTGFSVFFLIEKGIHWHHCHSPGEHKGHNHRFGILNLIGDGAHNFLDGILIGVSYIVSIPAGIATTIAIIAHEVPQEIGDFGVLVYAGFSRKKALMFNFLSALLAVAGAVLGWLLFKDAGFVDMLIPVVAGSFVYIATTDLIPELHKEGRLGRALIAFAFFILGLVVLYFTSVLITGGH